ncbi:helix-turn-helix domain-containing protein [Nocardia yamanashiensis]|uniref:helix-turn-helix domain-containing protein n=1 Tax=Nocardia yamanashiensis TaxID=209247 RepID=UPI001E3C3BE6|nr:helix-turn-helix domain-containing protein [Nocardia yamanashiensis]UGT43437.1 helix-turn-helix domain-containing protein [Nocardia yamanashiensis]
MSTAGGIGGRQPKAVLSALVVLEEVAACGPGVTAREISRNLAMPRATAYRLLNLLVQQEYLVRTPDLSGFALGAKVTELAGMATPAPLPDTVLDTLEQLRAHTRGGIHLTGYLRTTTPRPRVRILDADPEYPIEHEQRITTDLTASAIGRLALAESDPAAHRGYALQVDELRSGSGCLSLPIRNRRGVLVAGLTLSTTSARLRDLDAARRLLAPGRDRLEAAFRGH